MNFFTPELVLQSRSDDDDVAEAAGLQWQEARLAYRQRLKDISPQLRAGQAEQRIYERACLHGSQVLQVGQSQEKLRIDFQLEGYNREPGDIFTITYELPEGIEQPFQVKEMPALAEHRHNFITLYDELDFDDGNRCLMHLILLSGVELQIRFIKVTTSRMRPVSLGTHHAATVGTSDHLFTLD